MRVFAVEPIQVSNSVYFVRGETGLPSIANRGHTSNAGFVITGEGVVVFDALGTPVLGQQLLDSIRRITPRPTFASRETTWSILHAQGVLQRGLRRVEKQQPAPHMSIIQGFAELTKVNWRAERKHR